MSRMSYTKIETKKDCRMYVLNETSKEYECDALTELVCEKELCPFYKAKKQISE